jgi:hypothetical protein
MTEQKITEIVLPSGRFARIRKPQWVDIMSAWTPDGNPITFTTLVAVRITTFDDQKISLKEFLEADADEIAPIISIVNEIIGTVNKFGKGIA